MILLANNINNKCKETKINLKYEKNIIQNEPYKKKYFNSYDILNF